MRKLIVAFVFAALPGLSLAAGGGVQLDKANVDLSDTASLQRGAQLFTNYCLSCHSAQFMRYNRMGRDLGLSDEEVQQNLMFTTDKIGDTMTVAMTAADGKAWFGAPPPDLSVMARARGADYLYTYLRTFYVDEKRPFGMNNAVFADVGMPHVLWELQGMQKAVYKSEKAADGSDKQVLAGFELVTPGKLTPAEYDEAVRDLVNFMVYLGEPAQLERQRMGWWVLGFLALFFVVAYLLKKEYWKDVH
jgi:ubiquinol-cytochrome c reductase cytochrome c1 subunit